jgi:hypothetical protein
LIVGDPGSAVRARFSADEADLVRLRMGPFSLHVFSGDSWLRDAAADPGASDAASILAPGARIVDFSGYYLSGPENPAYRGASADLATPAVTYVSWDEGRAEFLPPAAGDWRPWPWPPGADPFILGIHGSSGEPAFSGPDMRAAAAPWAVGSWIRGLAGLKIAVRPLADPVVLMSCTAARSAQAMADETGRLVWGPTGDVSLGGEPVSLADPAAGVRAVVRLDRTADGRPGRFRSAYPQGPAGDLVRHSCRERFGTADISWLAEQFATPAAAAPVAVRPRRISGHGRLSGWSFYDERDWNSRRAALRPARIGAACVTWVPGGAYQPGTPRQLDPATGKIAAQAEPWHVSAQAALPFDADDALFAAGYFARGHFLVTGQDDNVTYLEKPLEFGRRLRREHDAATAAGRARGQARPRPVVLLTDHEPVPQRAARLVARGLGAEVITVSRPATMFLDDHPAAGIPETRVALLPGGVGAGTPAWTRTTPAGVSARLTAPPAPGRGLPHLAEPDPPAPGSGPAALPAPGPPGRPRDLAHVREALEAGTGLTPEALQLGLQAATASVLAVRRAAGIDFAGPGSQGQRGSALDALPPDAVFDLLEINGEYRPPAPAGPVTGQFAHTSAPWLAAGRRALPPGAADNPLYVLADYYGGHFLLSAVPAADQAITIRAEGPRDFGRRIRAEITPPGREPAQPPPPSRPVVLLARHRPVPPHVAATLAEELGNASGGLYTASMPATAYGRPRDGAATPAVPALVRLPSHADEPYWTLTTPSGLISRIDAPPPRHDIGSHAAITASDPAPGPATRQRPIAWSGAGHSAPPYPPDRVPAAGAASPSGALRDGADLAEGSDQVRFVSSHASSLPETDLANYQRQVREAGDDHPAEWHIVTGLESVRAVMAAAAPGSRGFVLVRPAVGRQVSRVFNAHRDGRGRVWFLDGQRGEEADPAADRGPGQHVFIPLTHGIGVPEGAAGTQPDETGLAGATGTGAHAPSQQPTEPDMAGPVIHGPALRLRGGADPEPDIIQNWKRISRAGQLGMRSTELRRVDAAVAAVAQEPGSASRLRDALAAIQAWQQTKNGPSSRDTAMQLLRVRVQDDLDHLGGPAGDPAAGGSMTAAARPAGIPGQQELPAEAGTSRSAGARAHDAYLPGPVEAATTPGLLAAAWQAADRAVLHLAGEAVLDARGQREVVLSLLGGPPAADGGFWRRAVLVLEAADARVLGELFGDGGELLGMLAARIPADDLRRGELAEFIGRRFRGGWPALAAGTAEPQGQQPLRFRPELLDHRLEGVKPAETLTDEAGMFTDDEVDLVIDVMAQASHEQVIGHLRELPAVQRQKAARWLLGARVQIHSRALRARDSEQKALGVLEGLLTWIYRAAAAEVRDARDLRLLTMIPHEGKVTALRKALGAPAEGGRAERSWAEDSPAEGNWAEDPPAEDSWAEDAWAENTWTEDAWAGLADAEPETGIRLLGSFKEILRRAYDGDRYYYVEKIVFQKGDEDRLRLGLHSMEHIGDIARWAKQQVDGLFGRFATSRPLIPARPGEPGNIRDQFVRADELIADMTGPSRHQAAAAQLRTWLSAGNTVTQVLAEYAANPVFGEGGDPLNEDAEIVAEVIEDILRDPARTRDILAIWRGWPAEMSFETHEVWIQTIRSPDVKGNQFFLWRIAQTLIHEYIHLLEHPDFTAWLSTLGSDARDKLREGVPSLLQDLVWLGVDPREPGLRLLIEGKYASEPPLSTAEMPSMAEEQRYASYADVMKLLHVVGNPLNLYAAFFLGDVEKIRLALMGSAPAVAGG